MFGATKQENMKVDANRLKRETNKQTKIQDKMQKLPDIFEKRRSMQSISFDATIPDDSFFTWTKKKFQRKKNLGGDFEMCDRATSEQTSSSKTSSSNFFKDVDDLPRRKNWNEKKKIWNKSKPDWKIQLLQVRII